MKTEQALPPALYPALTGTFWYDLPEAVRQCHLGRLGAPAVHCRGVLPSYLVSAAAAVPEALRWTLSIMGLGVVLSGIRDLYAALGLPQGGWPWAAAEQSRPGAKP